MSYSLGPMDYSPPRLLCPCGLYRQEQWSGLPCPPPGDLPNPWIQHASPISPALAGGFFTAGATWEALIESYTATFHGGGGLVSKSCPTLAIPWTVARQAPLSMGFSRQEYWSGWPFPPPGDLPDQGIKPVSPASPALAGRFFTTEPSVKPMRHEK